LLECSNQFIEEQKIQKITKKEDKNLNGQKRQLKKINTPKKQPFVADSKLDEIDINVRKIVDDKKSSDSWKIIDEKSVEAKPNKENNWKAVVTNHNVGRFKVTHKVNATGNLAKSISQNNQIKPKRKTTPIFAQRTLTEALKDIEG
jgi:hypothetical protein